MPVLTHARTTKRARIRQTIVTPPTLNAPSQFVANSQATQIVLSWSNATGAAGTEVERKATGEGSFSQVETTTGTTYTDTDVSGTDPYTYRLRHYRMDGATTTYSAYTPETAAALPDVSGSALTLGATMKSIDIEMPFSGESRPTYPATGGTPATATTRYSINGGVDWEVGLPLWRSSNQFYENEDGTLEAYTQTSGGVTSQYIDPNPYNAFVGSILNCTPNTTYLIEVTLANCNETGVYTGQITTRAEDITAAASLTATHTLASSGGDYATVAQVIDAWAAAGGNWYVECADGTYDLDELVIPSGVSGSLCFFNNTHPAVVSGVRANAGACTVFRDVNPPTAIAGGSWTLVPDVVGPTTGLTYSIWTYTLPGGTTHQPRYLSYSATAAGDPHILLPWNIEANASLPTLAHKAEFVYEADRYNYGWFVAGQNSNVIYLRMPGDLDPNDYVMSVGSDALITSNANGTRHGGATVRFSGIEFRNTICSIQITAPAHYHVVDHCYFHHNKDGIRQDGNSSTGAMTTHNVIEDCVFKETGLRAAPGVAGGSDGDIAPWGAVKGKMVYGAVGINRCCADAEGHGIFGVGGSRWITIRRNVFDGLFNGISNPVNQDFGPYAASCYDVYDNTFRNIADDCFMEHERNCMNFRAWNNRAEYVSVLCSTADGCFGPQYVWGNQVWNWGSYEMAGLTSEPTQKNVSPVLFKTSGKNIPTNRIYFVNNTAYTNQPATVSLDRPRALQNTNSGNPGTKPNMYWRNNLLCVETTGGRLSWNDASVDQDRWDEDYNAMAAQGGHVVGNSTFTSISAYRSAIGDGANTNKVGTAGADVALNDWATIKALMTDPENGDLSLAVSSEAEGAGVAVPMMTGATPDIGYEGVV